MQVVGVSEGVLSYLRVNIITGSFSPGERLNEISLSSSLGISRAPLREALRILENEQLVVSVPRRGCYVTPISMDNCKDIYNTRIMMETFAIETLEAQSMNQLYNVEAALNKFYDLSFPDDNDPYGRFDYLKSIANFHINLIKSAGNRRLILLYDSIFPSLARYQSLYTYNPQLMSESEDEHTEILSYIKKRKYSDAREFMRFHINKFIPMIEDKVEALSKKCEIAYPDFNKMSN